MVNESLMQGTLNPTVKDPPRLDPCYSKCGSQTSRVRLNWELPRKAESQDLHLHFEKIYVMCMSLNV